MDRLRLLELLRETRGTDQLSRLFDALGYQAEDAPFDWGARVVARWRGFRVVGAQHEAPRDGVKTLARALSSASERALAVSVGSDGAIAMAAPRLGRAGITRTLVIESHGPSTFALRQLERLRPARSATALAHALRVAEVLSSEEVGDRFFTALRVVRERMAASLTTGGAEERQMLALLNLTRILFLYFVQEKGWLDGRPEYLRETLDAALARRAHFHRTVLRPLFFGTLNRRPAARSSHALPGSIPYLNGGLFAPHPVELRWPDTVFSNEMWRYAFDDLFERFRFCVREGDEVDAVAPDMLGRAFERLMEEGERARSGTFYTPEAIVRQIVTATLETALEGQLPKEIVRTIMRQDPVLTANAQRVDRVLRGLRVLDPAVGSGAFLLGALDVLTGLRLALKRERDARATWRVRRQVLRANLFGVDLNETAVRLAELRLWLAVVADDPTEDIRRVAPLPNLDGVVRQGDSLLDPIGAAAVYAQRSASGGWARLIGEARRGLFAARGPEHVNGVRRLRGLEARLANHLLDDCNEKTKRALTELVTLAREPNLFGTRTGFTKAQERRHRALKRLRTDLRLARRELSRGRLPFFSFEVHVPDVMRAGGFDAVIGNPPWVRAERIAPSRRAVLADRFKWWTAGGERGFRHLPDLSVAFLERCVELTAPSGAVGLLLPSKVSAASYAEAARQALVRETTIAYVHRVPDRQAAQFGATTYPMALVLKKENPTAKHSVKLGFGTGRCVLQHSLRESGPWVLVSQRIQRALAEFLGSGIPLEEAARPALRVKTGADRLLTGRRIESDGELTLVEFAAERVLVESSALRPALRGRDIRAFRTEPKLVVVWGYERNGRVRSRLPSRIAAYVERHARELRARSDYDGGPPWTLFRLRAVSAKHRVVWSDIARRPRSVALDATAHGATVPLNTCYVAPTPDDQTALVLAAVLNSTWAAAFISATADEARGQYRRINARAVSRIPVPPAGATRVTLAELSRRAHREDVDREDVDAAVADALGLSPATRRALRSLANRHR